MSAKDSAFQKRVEVENALIRENLALRLEVKRLKTLLHGLQKNAELTDGEKKAIKEILK